MNKRTKKYNYVKRENVAIATNLYQESPPYQYKTEKNIKKTDSTKSSYKTSDV